ncbi:26S proteasome non-ATPase regulatory subunit 9-like [Mya arenaria]|uniref:26S proteasome non-ATPase regulatory subunit 9-like n=1 Tax=Mya arenaria TaxID=6604 RepID=UPI0022E924DA|nr:26S proteasome non-ATPase regulatory subunit 9-like [Mya arenaria]
MAASMGSEKMSRLIKKREEIEAEIKALNEVLDSQKSIGMDGPLIDTEGFPRADIDIYSVRHARHQIICLQNDYKDIMDEIEEELYRIHAEARQSAGDKNSSQSAESLVSQASRDAEARSRLQPIGTVTNIDAGSPADTAGLKVGDVVIRFGSLTSENFQGLQNIANIVQHSMDKPIQLTVFRDSEDTQISLTPKRWKPDKGLLGCNIKPVTSR